MFHRILVAMDNSALAQHVFNKAVSLAKASDACLMLLHVVSPTNDCHPTPWVFPSSDSVYQMLHNNDIASHLYQQERFEQQGLELLRSHWETATLAGILTEFTQNLGSPSQIICHVARTWNADLIVIGCRRFSGSKKQNSDSINDYVTHHASCSVLTVQYPPHTNPGVAQVRYTNQERLQNQELMAQRVSHLHHANNSRNFHQKHSLK
ncbi:MAG: universal stress protein [Coleofasciculus sp. S288]|nr:universal stress protein [Coleofasciculus sp. S288]